MFNQWHFRNWSRSNSISVSASTPDEIADVIVALANTNGGFLIDVCSNTHAVIIDLANQCLPAIDVSPLSEESIVSIPRSTQIHATPDKRVLIRSKTQNVELNGEQIQQLAQKRSIGNYENEVVPSAGLNNLDITLVEHFCDQLEIKNLTTHLNEILAQIGALDEHLHPTVAGILLFGNSPQRWLPQSGIRINRFVGKISSPNTTLIQQQEVLGNLWTILETLHQWVHHRKFSATNQIDLPRKYPAAIVFEALYNAVIHREYRLQDQIEINIYDDSLQIVSPGALPSFVELNQIENYRFYRNSTIADILSVWRHGQNISINIEQMKAQAVQNQLALEFTSDRNCVSLSIPAENTSSIENNAQSTKLSTINWRQERAIRYIQECGSLTYHEFHALCPDIEQQILFSDLVDLVEKKLVIKAGTKNVFFYLQHE